MAGAAATPSRGGQPEPAASSSAERATPRDRLLIAIIVVGTFGLLIAAYLTYEHYTGLKSLPCVGGHHGQSSCEQVQSSVYSKVGGVSVALLGLLGYIGILGSLLLKGDLGRGIGFGIALIGFGFSAYLTYREIFTIKLICEWCVTSAICMTILVVLTGIRFLRAEPGT